MLDEVAEADDDDVAHQQETAERDVPVLVDGTGDDVRAARAAASQEDGGKSEALEEGADDACHELLFAQDVHEGRCAVRCQFGQLHLHEVDADRDEQGDDNGADEVAPAEDAHRHQQQGDVDEQVSVSGREACHVVYHGGDTGHAAADNLVGQQEGGIANRVDDGAQEHLQVVAQQLPGRRAYDGFKIQGC